MAAIQHSCLQAGPGLWTAKVGDSIPLLRRLPYALKVNDSLLLLVLVAGCEQVSGQIWRTLTGNSVRAGCMFDGCVAQAGSIHSWRASAAAAVCFALPCRQSWQMFTGSCVGPACVSMSACPVGGGFCTCQVHTLHAASARRKDAQRPRKQPLLSVCCSP